MSNGAKSCRQSSVSGLSKRTTKLDGRVTSLGRALGVFAAGFAPRGAVVDSSMSCALLVDAAMAGLAALNGRAHRVKGVRAAL
jgi:hypothetical protein